MDEVGSEAIEGVFCGLKYPVNMETSKIDEGTYFESRLRRFSL